MIRVKLLRQNRIDGRAGDIVEVSPARADFLIGLGLAEPAEGREKGTTLGKDGKPGETGTGSLKGMHEKGGKTGEPEKGTRTEAPDQGEKAENPGKGNQTESPEKAKPKRNTRGK